MSEEQKKLKIAWEKREASIKFEILRLEKIRKDEIKKSGKKVKKQNQYYMITHRGNKNTDFGIHARIPLSLQRMDANSLLVLAFIDIDQFNDTRYIKGGGRKTTPMNRFVNGLGMSESTIKRAITDLKKRKVITVTSRERIGTNYVTNILKLNVRYQILTFTFIVRLDLSSLAKALVLKLIMQDNDRLNNLGNIGGIIKETGMARNSIYKVFEELNDLHYIYETEEGIFALDVERIMLDSDSVIISEIADLRKRNKELSKEIKKIRGYIKNENKKNDIK